jgi:histone chaperone ASF1
LEWKVIYVGSAENTQHDQTLEEVLVGPVPVGINKFVLQSDPPDFTSIPSKDIIGVTVVLVTCLYKDQEFIRVGYYVNNEYIGDDPSSHNMNDGQPPTPFDKNKVQRRILADKPRVTRFPIQWSKQSTDTDAPGESEGANNDNEEDGHDQPIEEDTDQHQPIEEDEQEDVKNSSGEAMDEEAQNNGTDTNANASSSDMPEEEEATTQERVEGETAKEGASKGGAGGGGEGSEQDIAMEEEEEVDDEEEEEEDDDDDSEIDLGDDEETFREKHKQQIIKSPRSTSDDDADIDANADETKNIPTPSAPDDTSIPEDGDTEEREAAT